ncbi:hypothetical protein PO124_12570 [Bacillus licheniformis]|nr:hypothetical protein [Bacillus licheniformis]
MSRSVHQAMTEAIDVPEDDYFRSSPSTMRKSSFRS